MRRIKRKKSIRKKKKQKENMASIQQEKENEYKMKTKFWMSKRRKWYTEEKKQF